MKYKNTTFVNILLIFSHYKPGKPFLKGAPFFLQPPVQLHRIEDESQLDVHNVRKLWLKIRSAIFARCVLASLV